MFVPRCKGFSQTTRCCILYKNYVVSLFYSFIFIFNFIFCLAVFWTWNFVFYSYLQQNSFFCAADFKRLVFLSLRARSTQIFYYIFWLAVGGLGDAATAAWVLNCGAKDASVVKVGELSVSKGAVLLCLHGNKKIRKKNKIYTKICVCVALNEKIWRLRFSAYDRQRRANGGNQTKLFVI